MAAHLLGPLGVLLGQLGQLLVPVAQHLGLEGRLDVVVAGRDALRESVRVALARICRGLPAKSVLMVGLRGVGKTVLLDALRDDAESQGLQTLRIEAPEKRSLPAILAPELRQALLRLSRHERAKELAARASDSDSG